MSGKKRAIAILGTLTCLALPAPAALYQSNPPIYGEVILSVDTHFELTDRDNSGTLSEAEYVAVSDKLKEQPASEARKDFQAMDTDGNHQLDLKEFYGEMPSELTI